MHYRRCKKPKSGLLAKDVPAKGMHGYMPQLEIEERHWERRKASAANLADPASEEAGSVLAEELHDCIVVGGIWQETYGAVNIALPREHPYWYKWNNFRRDALGVLALSRLCRSILPPESQQHLVEVRSATPEELSRTGATILIEPAERREGPEDRAVLDKRAHLSPNLANFLLGPLDHDADNPTAVWYKREDGLYIRRQIPAQPTEPYMVQLMELDTGIQVDFNQLQTLFPYLPAR